MNIHSLPVIASQRTSETTACRTLDGRLLGEDQGGLFDRSTDRPTGIKVVAPPISLQVLLQQLVAGCYTCSLQVLTCNFYHSCEGGFKERSQVK